MRRPAPTPTENWPSLPSIDFAKVRAFQRNRPWATALIYMRQGDTDYLFDAHGTPTGVAHNWDEDSGELADTAFIYWEAPFLLSATRDVAVDGGREAGEYGKLTRMQGKWGPLFGDPRDPTNVNGLTMREWQDAAGGPLVADHAMREELQAWQRGEDPSDYRAERGRGREAGEQHAADFSSRNEAYAAALQQGATGWRIFPSASSLDAIQFFREGESAHSFYRNGKYHLSAWQRLNVEVDARTIRPMRDLHAGEATETANVVYEAAAGAPHSFLVMTYGDWGSEPYTTTDSLEEAVKKALAASKKDPKNEYVIEFEPGGFDSMIFKNGKQVSGRVGAAEEAAAPRHKRSGPLRWKRAGSGHYKADGIRGPYEVKRIKPNRRAGILPWNLIYKGTTVRTFESADEAKHFGQSMDTILSDPTLCPTPAPQPRAVLPPMRLPPPSTGLRPPPPRSALPRLGKQQGWKGYADERPVKRAATREEAGEAIPFEYIERDVVELEAGRAYGKINTSLDVYNLLHDDLKKASQEVFVVLPLSLKNELLCKPVEVARGQRDRVGVDESDILRPVLVKNASSFYVVHQHPSGDASKPSKADIALTNSIIKAAKAACPTVDFVSHVIIGHGMFYDFATKKCYRVKS